MDTPTTLHLKNHFLTTRTIEILDADVANNIDKTTNANDAVRGHNNRESNNKNTCDININNYGSNRRETDTTLTNL